MEPIAWSLAMLAPPEALAGAERGRLAAVAAVPTYARTSSASASWPTADRSACAAYASARGSMIRRHSGGIIAIGNIALYGSGSSGLPSMYSMYW